MLRRKGSSWELYPHKVHYTQRGEQKSQWALPDKQWWSDFADKWDHTTIDKFEDVKVTEAMQQRFEEIKHMPEDFKSAYIDYVLDGTFPDDLPVNHPFNIVKLRKQNEVQGQNITDEKIKAMEQGQKQTDFELRLVSLEGK